MQYFKPQTPTQFVGDCMPFFHEGTFHLFYLLDEEHHRARNGFGAHQWAHASSRDLIHWQHHPLAIPVGEAGEFDYLSICTGSVFFHEGIFYAFYATRRVGEDGQRGEHLCRAISRDGIHFAKDPANPIFSPAAPYDTYNFRDPFVFQDAHTGRFHMLVTACVASPEVVDRAGCLAHLVSSDLEEWRLEAPFLADQPGRPGYYISPECCDYFHWNGWYYLVFSNPPHATTYVMAREPFGPWRAPENDALDTPMARVFKTAAFTGNRRLAVAFLMSLAEDKDDGRWEYAGNALFRELVQHADGTLGTRWPAEMIPAVAPPLALHLAASGSARIASGSVVEVVGQHDPAVTTSGLPADARITLRVVPGPGATYFGLRLRGDAEGGGGYRLVFAPAERTVRIFSDSNPRTVHHRCIAGVGGLDRPFGVDILLIGDIVDVCVDGRRTLCTRLPEHRGDTLAFFNETGEVRFEEIEVRPLAEHVDIR